MIFEAWSLSCLGSGKARLQLGRLFFGLLVHQYFEALPSGEGALGLTACKQE